MQPNTLLEALSRTDAQSRNWPCTPEYAQEFMALMLVFELNEIRLFNKWVEIVNFTENYLNHFYRSSKPQDALTKSKPGEISMINTTRDFQLLWNPYAVITEKLKEIRGQFREKKIYYPTAEDLEESVFEALKADLPEGTITLYRKAIKDVVSWGQDYEKPHH